MNHAMLIYKVFRNTEYQAFLRDGKSAGAPVDLADGFIHFSTASQLPGTLCKHFAGEQGLYLLAVDSEQVSSLKWEPSRGGDFFPHLYQNLYHNDILWSRPLPLGSDGHEIGELE